MNKKKRRDITFSKNLRKLRLKKDMTQEEVANILHIERSTYSCYENGKTEPSLHSLKKLAVLFNTDVDSLISKNL